MPRELKKQTKIPKKIYDGMSGEYFHLYHRTVTTDDLIRYKSEIATATLGKNGSEEVSRVQLENALEFIDSVEAGYFTFDGKPISCDENDTEEKYNAALEVYNSQMQDYESLSDSMKKKTDAPVLKVKGIYNPGWKEIIKQTAGDILIGFSKYLFGEYSFVVKDDPSPFVQTSKAS